MSLYKIPKKDILSGDVINFRYNNKRRYVIVMECPNDSGRSGKFKSKDGKVKRFLHGIQIPVNKEGTMELIIKKIGGTRVLFESNGNRVYTINFGNQLNDIMNSRAAYEKIKSDVDKLSTAIVVTPKL